MEAKLEFWDEDTWKEKVKKWPKSVRKAFGAALRTAQRGSVPASHAKPLNGFAIPLWELTHRSGARVVYTVHFVTIKNCVYVLDAFDKDSANGKKMRKDDKARISSRAAALKKRLEPSLRKLH